MISFGRYCLSNIWKFQCKRCGARVIGTKYIDEAMEATKHNECNENHVHHIWLVKDDDE
jgi:hypothetical protein